MGLKSHREARWINYEFPHPKTSERGGVLVINQASGVDYADYVVDPSGKTVLGIKLDDHEWIEEQRQKYPGGIKRVRSFFDRTRILVAGDVITDWIHPDYSASIKPGDRAFAGPSGTLVNSNDYSSDSVGVFLSTVGASMYNIDSHNSYTVLLEGGGLSYTWQDPADHVVKTINSEQRFVPIGGWVKLKISLPSKG